MNSTETKWVIAGTVVMILVVFSMWIVSKTGYEAERKEWEQFRQLRRCVVVEEKPSVWSQNTDGSWIITPAMQAWKCGNGVVYWRTKQ